MTVLRVSKRSTQVAGKGSVLDVLQVITEIFLSLLELGYGAALGLGWLEALNGVARRETA